VDASIIDGDVATAVREVKDRQAGDLLKFGTGELDLTLIGEGLVDELHLWVFPVIAGGGRRLLDGIDTTHLALLDTTPFKSGIVVHFYGPK
jgi:dihydrofolate reductase